VDYKFYSCFIIFTILSALPFLIAYHRKKFDIFEPIYAFIIDYYLLYGIRSLDLYNGGQGFLGSLAETNEGKEEIISALVLAIVGLTSFLIIYFAKYSYLRTKCVDKLYGWNKEKTNLFVLLIFTAGASACIFMMIASGAGPIYYFTHLNIIRLTMLNDVAPVKYLINWLSIAFLMKFLVSHHESKALWLLFAAALLGNFIFAHRYFAIFTVLYVLMLFHYLYQKISVKKFALVIALLIIFNGFYAVYRDFTYVFPEESFSWENAWSAYRSEDETAIAPLISMVYSAGVHGSDSLITIQRAIADGTISYNYGSLLMSDLITFAIPFQIWPSKPLPSSIKFNNLLWGDDVNAFDPSQPSGGVVETILGALYWAGGITGIVIGMLIFGWGMKTFYRRFIIDKYNRAKILIYCVGLPLLLTITNAPSAGFVKFVWFMVPLIILNQFLSNANSEFHGQTYPGRHVVNQLKEHASK
jgi:hypothetical protein